MGVTMESDSNEEKNPQRIRKRPLDESMERNEFDSISIFRLIDAMMIQQEYLLAAQMDKLKQLLSDPTGQRLDDVQTPEFHTSWKSKELQEIHDMIAELKETTALLKKSKKERMNNLIDQSDEDESVNESGSSK